LGPLYSSSVGKRPDSAITLPLQQFRADYHRVYYTGTGSDVSADHQAIESDQGYAVYPGSTGRITEKICQRPPDTCPGTNEAIPPVRHESGRLYLAHVDTDADLDCVVPGNH